MTLNVKFVAISSLIVILVSIFPVTALAYGPGYAYSGVREASEELYQDGYGFSTSAPPGNYVEEVQEASLKVTYSKYTNYSPYAYWIEQIRAAGRNDWSIITMKMHIFVYSNHKNEPAQYYSDLGNVPADNKVRVFYRYPTIMWNGADIDVAALNINVDRYLPLFGWRYATSYGPTVSLDWI